jgi:integrase
MLEPVARKRGRQRPVIRVRASRHVPPPVLSPGQIEAICEACARFDAASGQWAGQVRDRLLWSLLAEAGLRLGEALGLQHRDWHTGRGDTPFIEVVPREHPHGVRVKGGTWRRVFISDELDRLSTGSTCGRRVRGQPVHPQPGLILLGELRQLRSQVDVEVIPDPDQGR